MLKIKQELQEGLALALADLTPDAAARGVFESPKVAAHGDFATTAAMQLAKPLMLNPAPAGRADPRRVAGADWNRIFKRYVSSTNCGRRWCTALFWARRPITPTCLPTDALTGSRCWCSMAWACGGARGACSRAVSIGRAKIRARWCSRASSSTGSWRACRGSA